MLGGKYKEERENKKNTTKVDMQIKDIEKAPADHDWSKTPAYLEHVKGFSEVMSLMTTDFAKEMLVQIKEKRKALAER